ncbi:rod shape-determining protein RodA [Porphyromonadaceae bacterium W3.11]|nr:rod shape-determining protein RodA [Porphyromonadaceae bacterium W3.11]
MVRNIGEHKKKGFFQNIDLITVSIYLLLIFLGWLSVYAAGYDLNPSTTSNLTGRAVNQLVWLGVSFATAIFILLIESSFLKRITPLLYVLMILLLIVTLFIAPNIKGSHSWLVITNSVHIQPAEFSKVTTAMMLAWWGGKYGYDIKKPMDLMVSLLIFLLPLLIIILQSETGSALVFLSFFIVLYREGLTSAVLLYGIFLAIIFIFTLRFTDILWGVTDAGHMMILSITYLATVIAVELYAHKYRWTVPFMLVPLVLFTIFGIISIFTPINFAIPALISVVFLMIFLAFNSFTKRDKKLISITAVMLMSLAFSTSVEYFFDEILQPHQQTRILVSLGMKDDPSGAGYNIHQSLIAIGSGQLTGKGFLNGTQTKLAYVPEQDTDFIFCTVGEEQGFIGSVGLLLIYLLLLLRLIHIAERQESSFTRIYGYSVVCIIFFHLMINIGMVIGLLPVIGIPLPFFSYGGSSMLSFSILLFILLRLDSQRDEIR